MKSKQTDSVTPPSIQESHSLFTQWHAEILALESVPADLHFYTSIPFKLMFAEETVRLMLRSRKDLFLRKVKRGPGPHMTVEVSPVGHRVLQCLSFPWFTMRQLMPGYRFNAYCELFADAAMESGLTKHDLLPHTVDKFCELTERIRTLAASAGVTKMVRAQLRSARENCESLLEYIDELFRFYSKIVVVRVDFSFKKINRALTGDGMADAAYVRKAYKRFMRHRDREFPDMIGFARKLEYAAKTGYHIHCLFFFNGNKVRNDVEIGRLLCNRWLTVTGEHGRAHNVNGDEKTKYLQQGILGIGMIGYTDWKMRRNLNYVAEYMTKADYYVRLVAPIKGMRTCTHGVPPRQKGRGGRPRSVQRQLQEVVDRLKALAPTEAETID